MRVVLKIINKPVVNLIIKGEGGKFGEDRRVPNRVKRFGKIESNESHIGIGGEKGGNVVENSN